MTVVEFKKPEPEVLVWACGDCEGTTWFVKSNDTMECSCCGRISTLEPEHWKKMPPIPCGEVETAKLNMSVTTTIDFQLEDFKRNFDPADGDYGVILKGGGRIYTFGQSKPDTEEVGWIKDQMQTATKMLCKEDVSK